MYIPLLVLIWGFRTSNRLRARRPISFLRKHDGILHSIAVADIASFRAEEEPGSRFIQRYRIQLDHRSLQHTLSTIVGIIHTPSILTSYDGPKLVILKQKSANSGKITLFAHGSNSKMLDADERNVQQLGHLPIHARRPCIST